MSAPQFTPAPWAIDYPSIYAVGKGVRVGRVAAVSIAYKDTATYEANARLIAAAPELYEALEAVTIFAAATIDKLDLNDTNGIVAAARAALAKARGEA